MDKDPEEKRDKIETRRNVQGNLLWKDYKLAKFQMILRRNKYSCSRVDHSGPVCF